MKYDLRLHLRLAVGWRSFNCIVDASGRCQSHRQPPVAQKLVSLVNAKGILLHTNVDTAVTRKVSVEDGLEFYFITGHGHRAKSFVMIRKVNTFEMLLTPGHG